MNSPASGKQSFVGLINEEVNEANDGRKSTTKSLARNSSAGGKQSLAELNNEEVEEVKEGRRSTKKSLKMDPSASGKPSLAGLNTDEAREARRSTKQSFKMDSSASGKPSLAGLNTDEAREARRSTRKSLKAGISFTKDTDPAKKSVSASNSIANRQSIRRLFEKKAHSLSNYEENVYRGSDYFGTAENSLLFGSSSTQIHKNVQEKPLEVQPSTDVLLERDSLIQFSETGSKVSGGQHLSSSTDPTTSSGNKSLVPNLAFPHHNLKARPSDLLYLKKRVFYPGIWEEDSDEEPDKATLINRRKLGQQYINNQYTDNSPTHPETSNFNPATWDEMSDLSEACTSKTGTELTAVSSQAPSHSTAPVSVTSQELGSSTSDKLKSSPLNTYEKRGSRKGKAAFTTCKKDVVAEETTKSEHHRHGSGSSGEKPHVGGSHGHVDTHKKKETHHKHAPSKAHEEGLSLLERICILTEESKHPMTLKERFLGHKPIYGFPGCFDKTEGYPECMKPGELVRTAINTKKLWKIPENTALSRDQFVSLMRNIEGHDRNDYICLVYSLPENHPDFNPYRFKIVKYNHVPPKTGHYTLSKYGFLHFSRGFAEYTSMVQFQTQMLIYDYIIKIPFFEKYRLWKAFTMWRVKIRGRKMTLFRTTLVEELFISRRPLQLVLKELIKMCEKISHLGFLKLKSTTTYSLEEFLGYESLHANEVLVKLRTFEGMVVEMTSAACRATLIEEGFSQDSYAEEMDFYVKHMEQPFDEQTKAFMRADYPGQWLTYSQQTKKNFIRLVDYHVQHTYYQIMKNSMVYMMLEMHQRVEFVPANFYIPDLYLEAMNELVEEHEKHGGHMVLCASTEPLFEVNCGWTHDNLVLAPTVSDFVKGFRFLCYSWKKTILSYENMVKRPVFNPYTQPIINGYVDKKTCGEGPSMKLLIQHDSHTLGVADVIQSMILHGFEVCERYIKTLDFVHAICLENVKLDFEALKKAGDAEVFTKMHEKLEEQFETLNHVDDLENLGVFRVNNVDLKTHGHELIIHYIEQLRTLALEEENSASDKRQSTGNYNVEEEEEVDYEGKYEEGEEMEERQSVEGGKTAEGRKKQGYTDNEEGTEEDDDGEEEAKNQENSYTNEVGGVTEEVSEATVGGATEEASEAAVGPVTEEVSEAGVGHVTEEVSEEGVGGVTEQASGAGVGGVTAQSSNEGVGGVTEQSSKAGVGGVTEQVSKEGVGGMTAQSSKEGVGGVTAQSSKAGVGGVTAQSSKEGVGGVTAQSSKEGVGGVTAQSSKAGVGGVTEQASKEGVGGVTEHSSKAGVGPVTEEVSKASVGGVTEQSSKAGVGGEGSDQDDSL